MRAAIFRAVLAAFVLAGVSTTALAESKKVAIALFGPHASLEQVSEGFKHSLEQAGIEAVYDEGNVNFDRSLVPQLLNRLAAGKPDLMLTITTPMAQSAKQILDKRDFPIVFAPVTDPVQAGLLSSWDAGAPLMTGVSNIPNLDATIEFMQSLVPNMKRLGILYNTGDDSDTAFVHKLQEVAPNHDVELVLIGVENANDIPQRVTSARGKADALFVPASSLLQPAAPAIASAAQRISLPVFGSNVPSVDDGHIFAVFAADFYRIGEKAGDLAVRIFNGEDAADLPVAMLEPEDHIARTNGKWLKALGLSLPESLKDCDCVVE